MGAKDRQSIRLQLKKKREAWHGLCFDLAAAVIEDAKKEDRIARKEYRDAKDASGFAS